MVRAIGQHVEAQCLPLLGLLNAAWLDGCCLAVPVCRIDGLLRSLEEERVLELAQDAHGRSEVKMPDPKHIHCGMRGDLVNDSKGLYALDLADQRIVLVRGPDVGR